MLPQHDVPSKYDVQPNSFALIPMLQHLWATHTRVLLWFGFCVLFLVAQTSLFSTSTTLPDNTPAPVHSFTTLPHAEGSLPNTAIEENTVHFPFTSTEYNQTPFTHRTTTSRNSAIPRATTEIPQLSLPTNSIHFYHPFALDKKQTLLNPTSKTIHHTLMALLKDQVLFEPASSEVFGPAPNGLWFRLAVPVAQPIPSPNQTAHAIRLNLGLSLVQNLYVFEDLPQGPQLIFQTKSTGLHSTVIDLPERKTVPIEFGAPSTLSVFPAQRYFIGYFEAPYPTRLLADIYTNESTAAPNITLARMLVLLFTLIAIGSIILGLHKNQQDPLRSTALITAVTCTNILFIAPISGSQGLSLIDPVIAMMLCAAIIWLTKVNLNNTNPYAHYPLRLPGRLLIPFFIIVSLGASVFSPIANGPVRLLAISILFAHAAFMHQRCPMSLAEFTHPVPLIRTKLFSVNVTSTTIALQYLSRGSLFGLSLLYLLWGIPLGQSFPKFMISPEQWITLNVFLLGLHITAHAAHTFIAYRLHLKAERQREADQLSLRDLNRSMLAHLNQHIANKPMAGTLKNSTAMRSGDSQSHRIRLDSIGESSQTVLEKVSEYTDISVLLRDDVQWNKAPFHVRAWISKHIASWSQRTHRSGKQLIVSVRPHTPIDISADEEKLTHMMQTLFDLSLCNTTRGNLVLRLDTSENETGELMYRITLQDTSTELPSELVALLNTSWLNLCTKPFLQTHLHYARILLAHRWLHLAGGSLSVEHDMMFGARYRITFQTNSLMSTTDTNTRLKTSNGGRHLLMMTYDAEYGATIAEQANHLNHPMSLALSTKQALRNLRHSQRSEHDFDALLIDFSRDAESLQGFVFELRENEQYCHIPIILLTNPEQRVEYLTQLLSDVFAVVRPGYFPDLISTINTLLFKLNPTLLSAIKSASFQLQ